MPALREIDGYRHTCIIDDAVLNRDVDWLVDLLVRLLGAGYSARHSGTLHLHDVTVRRTTSKARIIAGLFVFLRSIFGYS